ncbi:MAG TPA: DUF898 family protein [Pseudomonadota bacterium]|nr:DUF898 family protein [Pseudomonadota bacterium]HNK44985.1 DUF898 family protein [Pseudomonadota bacterium]HNN50280.1 DUF898 family protein [Pseudomonadota bacterium]HNO67664.1 DUF898 family protein [Pseudomonadota bacterium]
MQTESGLPQDIKAQLAPIPGGNPRTGVAGQVRFEYLGKPTELIGSGIVAMLLLMVTCGLAYPWIIAGAQRYYYSRIRIHTDSGVLTPEFTGTGFLCFVEVFLSSILVILTLGIYTPWYLANVLRYFMNNSQAVASDGTRYRLDYSGKGGELFVPMLVNMLLTNITLGIYGAWATCDLQKRIFEKTRILKGEHEIGKLDFVGTGGGLVGTLLLGMLLSMVTLGLYLPWFQCNMEKFFRRNTAVYIGERRYRGDFSGEGGELFLLMLQVILVPLTLGLYLFWLITKQNRFFIEKVSFQAE